MTTPVPIGILGIAHFHANFWARAISDSPEMSLTGVWDHDRERGTQFAEKVGTRFFTDLSELFHECEAVGITSETVRHAELIEQAAAAGKAILCEKPLAASRSDCDRIQTALASSGVLFVQNFPKRFDPINRELVDRVQSGALGDVAMVRIRHGHYHGLDELFQQQWFVQPELSGGGTLIDEGVHATDFLRWMLGRPRDVRAVVSNRALDLAVEDTASAIFTMESGAIAEVATSWTFFAAESSVEVFGTNGSAVLGGVDLASRDFAQPPFLRIYEFDGSPRRRWEESTTVPLFQSDQFHQQGPRHLVDCLLRGTEPAAGFEDGRKALEMVLAAYSAAESRTTVSLRR